MNKDIEADFWKNQFIHLLHKNLVRVNAKPLYMADAQQEFDKFSYANPSYKVEIQNSASYITWETFLTPTIKLRLFIQNQIKATLLQKNGNDLIKIADTKFPYNPFPEINEFLRNNNNLQIELEHILNEAAREERKMKLAGQFIKANLLKKYGNQTDVIWNLIQNEKDFLIEIKTSVEEKKVLVNSENFLEIIKTL